jgi:hypothetical protein
MSSAVLDDSKGRRCLQINKSLFTLQQPAPKLKDKLSSLLPIELQYLVACYLSPRECAIKMKSQSKYWARTLKDSKFWQLYCRTRPLSVCERLQIVSCLVERRSKGKLYKAFDRVTQETFLLRKIFLDVTNAGQDDGIPTSVLREISHLKALQHQNIGAIKHAEVKDHLALLVYEYHEQNLKEFVRKCSR